MPLKRPPLWQPPAGWPLPKTNREAFADALGEAEREFRAAQAALAQDDSNENRARYARALAYYDELQGTFPFVAAGFGDDRN